MALTRLFCEALANRPLEELKELTLSLGELLPHLQEALLFACADHGNLAWFCSLWKRDARL